MTDIDLQYRIIETAAGWIERASRGRLRFDGRDAVPFLQALLSNDIEALAQGQGVYATYLTPQGRMIADLTVYHRGEFLIADVPAAHAARLAAVFDGLIFAEDVTVQDVSVEIRQIAVIGREASRSIGSALSLDPAALDALPPLAQLGGGPVFAARSDVAGEPAFELFAPAAAVDDVMARLETGGARRISMELAEALRIEAARPAFGIDMAEDTIPLEAGLLERAISTTKGCYVGQEIIIRVLHRGGGRVARRLVRLDLDAAETTLPAAGARVSIDDRDVGRVTSASRSPRSRRMIALAYVARDAAVPGQAITVRVGDRDVAATIAALAG